MVGLVAGVVVVMGGDCGSVCGVMWTVWVGWVWLYRRFYIGHIWTKNGQIWCVPMWYTILVIKDLSRSGTVRMSILWLRSKIVQSIPQIRRICRVSFRIDSPNLNLESAALAP